MVYIYGQKYAKLSYKLKFKNPVINVKCPQLGSKLDKMKLKLDKMKLKLDKMKLKMDKVEMTPLQLHIVRKSVESNYFRK